MKSLQELTQNIPTRASVRPVEPTDSDIGGMTLKQTIDLFYERLKSDWNEKKYGKIRYMMVREQIIHLKKQDLHFFYKKCDEARSFGETFFYELDTKKHK